MISRDGEFFIKHVLPIGVIMAIVGILLWVAVNNSKAKQHLEDCLASKGDAVRCLARYEVERIPWGR